MSQVKTAEQVEGMIPQKVTEPNGSHEAELVKRYGFPAFKNDKGRVSKLNEPFWAAYHSKKEPEMLFEADEEEFYCYDEETGLFPASVVRFDPKKTRRTNIGKGQRLAGTSGTGRVSQ